MEGPKSENEKVQIKDEEKTESNPLQIISKLKFDEGILKINELSNKRIGILLNNSFLVYNLNNFKKLYEIKLPIISQGYYDDKGIFDFIELKNSDLVLWSTEKIFLYQLLENEYKLYQEIDKFETGENEVFKNDFFFRGAHKKFSINSIYELTNGKLICCNSFGLLIYAKINDKYIFESRHDIDIDVRKIIEINANKIILLQRYHYYFWGCSRNNLSSHTYSISTYDIENKNLTKVAESKVSNKDYYGYVLISYLIKNGYLLIRYGKKIDIYDINNNMALVNHDQEEMVEKKDEYYGFYECLKDEMDIIFLCDYLDNLIITKNLEKKARIYMLKDNSLQYVKEFPYQLKDLKEIIKLKNNSFIMYSDKELILLNNK